MSCPDLCPDCERTWAYCQCEAALHEAPHPHACSSECDCGTINGHPHEPDCHWWDHCDDGKYCDKHLEQAMQEHAWMAHVGLSAVTGEMSEQDKQDIRDAGRGHLLGDWL